MRRWRGRVPGGLAGGKPGAPVLILAGLAVLLGFWLLRSIFVIFQHAYLNSYFWVPGAGVRAAYWGAILFALKSTVLVVALIAVCAALAVLVLRGRRHR